MSLGELLLHDASSTVLRVLLAIAVVLAGWRLAGMVQRALRRGLADSPLDNSTRRLAERAVYYITLVAAVFIALSVAGVSLTSFAALFGSIGLTAGLVLRDWIADFASGLFITLSQPYVRGDTVQVAGIAGTVESIDPFSTVVRTGDNRVVTVPHRHVTAGPIINLSVGGTLRVEFTLNIARDEDVETTRRIIVDVLAGDGRVLPEPPPTVAVQTLNQQGALLLARAWVRAGNQEALQFDATGEIAHRLTAAGVRTPRPAPAPPAQPATPERAN